MDCFAGAGKAKLQLLSKRASWLFYYCNTAWNLSPVFLMGHLLSCSMLPPVQLAWLSVQRWLLCFVAQNDNKICPFCCFSFWINWYLWYKTQCRGLLCTVLFLVKYSVKWDNLALYLLKSGVCQISKYDSDKTKGIVDNLLDFPFMCLDFVRKKPWFFPKEGWTWKLKNAAFLTATAFLLLNVASSCNPNECTLG